MEKYIDGRIRNQKEWYEKNANKNKRQFVRYQTLIIVLGATIPVLVALESVSETLVKYGGVIAAFMAAMISVIAGLDKLKQPQPNWFNYRANEEMIKKEEWHYKYMAGPYKGMHPEEAKVALVERVENIISADIARTTNISESKKVNADGSKGVPDKGVTNFKREPREEE